MTTDLTTSPAGLATMIEAVLKDSGRKELLLDPKKVASFCRVTGHDYDWYQTRELVPAGFLMTFSAGHVTEVFVDFFTRFPEALKGVVHSSSRIRFQAPFCLSRRPLDHHIRLNTVLEKEGRKGLHFVSEFDLDLLEQDGTRILIDRHQFFMRV